MFRYRTKRADYRDASLDGISRSVIHVKGKVAIQRMIWPTDIQEECNTFGAKLLEELLVNDLKKTRSGQRTCGSLKDVPVSIVV